MKKKLTQTAKLLATTTLLSLALPAPRKQIRGSRARFIPRTASARLRHITLPWIRVYQSWIRRASVLRLALFGETASAVILERYRRRKR